ncbi:hypothetical protein, partial [Hyphomicrobium sp. 2TAF46]|uniref:hypothetical protein n=1 Tax=Hyphomicrobium sp. 2TAF46 TaxID=3233019 RepID=UPI003F937467
MPIQTAFRFSHRRSTELLLTSVSIAAMLVVAPGAGANPLANGNLPTPSAAAIAAAQSGQQEAARAARAAQNTLRRATLAVQAQQA